jgi:hypothetical protein
MKEGETLVSVLREGGLFRNELTGEKLRIVKIEEVWETFNDPGFAPRAKIIVEFGSRRSAK